MGRTQRNQGLAEFESGAGHLEIPLFLTDVTMPSVVAECLSQIGFKDANTTFDAASLSEPEKAGLITADGRRRRAATTP